MIDILMPRLSDTMTEGAISVWHKKPGDHVDVGDILVEVESDKAVMEQEAYEEGTLVEILVPEGENVAIGTPIARLDDGSPDSAPTERQSEATQNTSNTDGAHAHPATDGWDGTAAKPAAASEALPAATASQPVVPQDRLFASPIVRRLARERAVDLRNVTGTGPGGRIVRADLDATAAAEPAAQIIVPQADTTAAAPAPSNTADEIIPFDRIRQAIATRLTESGTRVPTFNVTASANTGELLELRARINSDRAAGAPKVSLNDLLIRASAIALRAHPLVNASYTDAGQGATIKHGHVNVGFAVASPMGLVVPVVRDADHATVTTIAAVTRDRIDKASDRKLTAAEMSGGTFTVSNLGMYGVEHFTAIINPPEGAILAVGAGYEELVLVEGEVQPQHRLRYTLTADHRIIDGALAAQFLATFTEMLEHPLRIVV